jgi:hypothetical protein
VRSAAIRGTQPRADDTHDDRAHRLVLAPSGVLAEHPLTHQHEHQQAGGQSRLHHRQGRQHQRHHLQGPAEDRQSSSQQPAPPGDQAPGESQTQVLLVGHLLGIHSLERDP